MYSCGCTGMTSVFRNNQKSIWILLVLRYWSKILQKFVSAAAAAVSAATGAICRGKYFIIITLLQRRRLWQCYGPTHTDTQNTVSQYTVYSHAFLCSRLYSRFCRCFGCEQWAVSGGSIIHSVWNMRQKICLAFYGFRRFVGFHSEKNVYFVARICFPSGRRYRRWCMFARKLRFRDGKCFFSRVCAPLFFHWHRDNIKCHAHWMDAWARCMIPMMISLIRQQLHTSRNQIINGVLLISK